MSKRTVATSCNNMLCKCNTRNLRMKQSSYHFNKTERVILPCSVKLLTSVHIYVRPPRKVTGKNRLDQEASFWQTCAY